MGSGGCAGKSGNPIPETSRLSPSPTQLRIIHIMLNHVGMDEGLPVSQIHRVDDERAVRCVIPCCGSELLGRLDRKLVQHLIALRNCPSDHPKPLKHLEPQAQDTQAFGHNFFAFEYLFTNTFSSILS